MEIRDFEAPSRYFSPKIQGEGEYKYAL